MKENYLAECLGKFHELPEELQEMIGGFEACLKIKKIEEAYAVSLSFAAILVAIGELSIDDLPDYLNLKYKLDKAKCEEIAKNLEEQIFAPVLDLILQNAPDAEGEGAGPENNFGPIMNMSLAEKKELILKTFESEIISAIKADPNKLQDFNVAIFEAFNADEALEDKVESLLYINQEKISDHHIILDGHPASPSIANWLKDFIKKYGSDIFNEVVLAEYLSQSPNTRNLKPDEKEILRKVLKLYYNLVFFPESMDGVPLQQWEVFPVDRSKLNKIRDVLADQPTAINETEIKVVPVATQVVEEEEPQMTELQKTIFDLQKNLAKYPTNSLEYKAIHQEINRLSRK